MILIPAGWFYMGSDNYYEWERPRHRVFIDAFEIAPTSVARREYREFLLASGTPEPRGWDDPLFNDDELPVVGVNWFDANAYCEWLSKRDSQNFRLPTEAEWEKACRGGHDGLDYAWGSESPDSLPYFQEAWNAPRRAEDWQPNPYGLFQMGHNVHEWCLDWFDPNYYPVSPDSNPAGPETGTRRVSRGGSWRHQIKGSRAAHRSSLPPEYRYTDYGFRVVRSEPMHVLFEDAQVHHDVETG